MTDLTSAFLALDSDLTAEEIKSLTDGQWPDRLVEDYLSKFETLLRIVRNADDTNDTIDFIIGNEETGLSSASGAQRRLVGELENYLTMTLRRELAQGDPNSIQKMDRRSIEDIQAFISSRRDESIDVGNHTQRRSEHYEQPSNADRRVAELEQTQSIPARLNRISIDNLTVESLVSGAIAPNVNATPANTVAQLELRDKSGNVYYLPLYGSPW